MPFFSDTSIAVDDDESDLGIALKKTPTKKELSAGRLSNRAAQTMGCCRRFFTVIFSTVGLCFSLIIYTILGGFLFMTLESQNEAELRQAMKLRRHEYVQKMWNITMMMNNNSLHDSDIPLFLNNNTSTKVDISSLMRNDTLEKANMTAPEMNNVSLPVANIKSSMNSSTMTNNTPTTDINRSQEEIWREIALGMLKEYTENVYKSIHYDGWDGREDGNGTEKWSFAGAMLYSITVITTIGKLESWCKFILVL